MKTKTLVTLVLVVAIIIIAIASKKLEPTTEGSKVLAEKKLCYQEIRPASGVLSDRYTLSMSILGEDVEGNFDYVPAEKDSKQGTFSGTAEAVNPSTMARRATLWWNVLAEGSVVQEKLLIDFGDGTAAVALGEMVDQGDGVYVYKDEGAVTWLSIPQTDCEDL